MQIHPSTALPVLPSGGAADGAAGNVPPLRRGRWARGLRAVGFAALLVGVLDPLEGSIVILAGSAPVALGTLLGPGERRWVAYRTAVFVLIAFGVAALFGLSSVGGLGPGHLSMWWGLLALPYLIGWTMGVWGPDSPRWVLWAGLALGAGCFALAVIAFEVSRRRHTPLATGFVLMALGAVTLAGCAYRLRQQARQQ